MMRWVDRGATVLGVGVGLASLWATSEDRDSWGLRKLIYIVAALLTVAVGRQAGGRFIAWRSRAWLSAVGHARGLDIERLRYRFTVGR